MTFEEALADSNGMTKNLLLGNGFSIACYPDIFQYASLFDEADFASVPNARELFAAIGTYDFERMIRALEEASLITPFYIPNGDGVASSMQSHANKIKEILLTTIAKKHPEKCLDIPSHQYTACRNFLANFIGNRKKGVVFTLNYDLLLYWAIINTSATDNIFAPTSAHALQIGDGFADMEPEEENDYVVWRAEDAHSGNTTIYFLHGALHLFDAKHELRKYTWSRTGNPLIEQIKSAIDDNSFPLFVAEGTSKAKLEKIRHNAYLYQCLKVFEARAKQQNHCLFIYGHSLADNDAHILQKIAKGTNKTVYISLYGSPDSEANQEIISNALALKDNRRPSHPLEVKFYDAASAKVWG